MRVLELFSGTGSVGKVCKKLGWEVVSLDLKGADINIDIMDWDYKALYKKGYFDIIWASPPCNTFSNLAYCNIGRKLKRLNGEVVTKEILMNEMETIGIPILRKTEEIIKYLNPTYYFIENPQTGRMKQFMNHHKHYDASYCMYGFNYRKTTRFWTNKEGLILNVCNKKCGKIRDNKHINEVSDFPLNQRYSIPEQLILYLLT
jgi:adenine-specific DNA methylase